ncbi:MAG TPA: hypothetical protein VK866_10065 [Acidimicrobiales bacterium]|nr:hypothetical protein [Acidimicrobiales bacterium]
MLQLARNRLARLLLALTAVAGLSVACGDDDDTDLDDEIEQDVDDLGEDLEEEGDEIEGEIEGEE